MTTLYQPDNLKARLDAAIDENFKAATDMLNAAMVAADATDKGSHHACMSILNASRNLRYLKPSFVTFSACHNPSCDIL